MIRQTLTERLMALNTSAPEPVLLLKNLFVPIIFRKGTLFHCDGYASPLLYFIETGQLRGYYFYNQKEYTAWLMETGFLLPAAGFFTKTPAMEHVQFLTDASGYSLNLEIAVALAQEKPLLYRMLLEIYETALHEGKHRELMLRLKTAGERLTFIKQAGNNLIYKVLNPIAASFLDVTEKYFSSVKRNNR